MSELALRHRRTESAVRTHDGHERAATDDFHRAERMPIVIAGHVDHGKSTIVGRLLADTGSLPEGKLEQIRALCARTGKPFEYAFLLDALKDERSQGITIDAARVFFRSARRHYVIIDAPGHVEFLKNMVSGAARAEAACLVVDAAEGVQENSRRHGYLLALLGISQVVVLVNKMDLVQRAEAVYRRVVTEYGDFLAQVGVRPAAFIPVAGRAGDNLAHRSAGMPWYHGPTLLEALDAFAPERPAHDRPLRLPVQEVYKFTARGDSRRIIAGTVEAGTLTVGDDVVFLPSGKRGRVRSIEAFNRPPQHTAGPGAATGFTLEQQIYVARGEMVTRAHDPAPAVATRIAVSVFWLGRRPLASGRDYLLKLGTARVRARLESVERVVDAATLAATAKSEVARHDVAECVLRLTRPIALDPVEANAATGRFVLVDGYEISGGGIVRSVLPDLPGTAVAPATPSPEGRAARFAQRPTLLLLAAADAADAAGAAVLLEARLFEEGRLVAHLPLAAGDRLAGAAAAADALLELGAIVVLSAGADVATAAAALGDRHGERATRAWIGAARPAGIAVDAELPSGAPAETADALWQLLRERRSVPGL